MNKSRNELVNLACGLAQEIATRADQADQEGKLPAADIKLLRESGYLKLTIPPEFGGLGLTLGDCVAAQFELAQASASTALVAAMQHQIFGHQREVCSWQQDVYERLCHEAADGSLFNYIASEPQMGSPSRGGLPATTAVPSADGQSWIINGHKTWSTGGRHLTHLLVRANVEEQQGVVLVTQDTPGIEWIETWSDSLSLRASDSHDVVFHNVVVPRNHLIETGDAKAVPNVWFPMILSAVYLGAATAARNCVIQFALERVPTALGKPIATLPTIQRQIGEMDVAMQAARALLFEVANLWHGNEADRPRIMPRIAALPTMLPIWRCKVPVVPASPAPYPWNATSVTSVPVPCNPHPVMRRWR